MLKSLGAATSTPSSSSSASTQFSRYAQKVGLGPYLGIEEEEEELVESRESSSEKVKPILNRDGEFDLLIVGGGATGAGIAVDAASRGLRVGLVERNDFSSGEFGLSFAEMRWIDDAQARGERGSSYELNVYLFFFFLLTTTNRYFF